MNVISFKEFIFSGRYRILRWVAYYAVHSLLWSCFWAFMFNNYGRHLVHMLSWIPAFVIFTFPIVYWMIPQLLLKNRYAFFIVAIIAWGVAGLFIHALNRQYIFIPMQEMLWSNDVYRPVLDPSTFLCMCTTAGEAAILVLFKHWYIKQKQWQEAQQGKMIAELQLLKAQVHPHFLFNTLNNIYAFSLQQSPKTPGLVLKLSSLLSYMLYDCKAEEVLLEKELEIMKNYIALEQERYGDKIDISINIEGDIQDRFIAPLLLLPFVENAFKHGASEQLTKPWLSFDLAVKQNTLWCKIVNSKNNTVPETIHGIGIENVEKRLGLLYPGKHSLKCTNEIDFYVVSLELQLAPTLAERPVEVYKLKQQQPPLNETAMPAHR